MSNPLMQAGNPAQMQQVNPQQEIEKMKSNSVGYLESKGFHIPENIASNPMAIAQHLIQSGQIPKTRLTNLMQMLGRR